MAHKTFMIKETRTSSKSSGKGEPRRGDSKSRNSDEAAAEKIETREERELHEGNRTPVGGYDLCLGSAERA